MTKFYFKNLSRILFLLLVTTGLAIGQSTTITGTVTDARSGEPLAGVNVVIKGTTQGTVCDANGAFSLTIPSGTETLLASFIGYRTLEVPISAGTTTLSIKLEEDVTSLEEVVVSGLATTVKRSNLANAVALVNADKLTGSTNAQTLDYALQGKIPGVNMTANSGAPGGGINMQIRGLSTIQAGNSQPLFVIDGVYIDNSVIRTGRTQVSGASGGQNASSQDDAPNRLADLNPDDIERVEVLKGPSASAIYGARANAGVVIITTKRGQSGKTKVSFNQDIGFAKGQNFQGFDNWDAEKVTAYYGTGTRGILEQQRLADAQAAGKGFTDWEDYFYGETGTLTNSQLSISGGNEKTNFYISGGLKKENGIIKNTGFDQFSVRANINHKLSERLTFGLNTNYVKSDNDRGFTGNQNNTGGSLGYNIAFLPSYALNIIEPDAQGNYANNPYFNDNPIAIRDRAVNNQIVDRFITAGNLGWDIIQKPNGILKFALNGGVDFLSSRTLVYFPEDMQNQVAAPPAGDVMHGKQENFNANIQSSLVYDYTVGDIGLISQVGLTYIRNKTDFLLMRGRGLSAGQTNLFWADVVSPQAQQATEATDVGYYFQQDANWRDRVIASVGIRQDRSTLNLKQDKFYTFYKASLAINITNFDFWNVSAISQLKPRIALGQSPGVPAFGGTFESLTAQRIGGATGSITPIQVVDPDLRPETANELEFGLDAGFLNNRIGLEFTYYDKTINDIILNSSLAESTGTTTLVTNAGKLQNKGFEIGLTGSAIKTDNIDWNVTVLYWQNRSKMLEMDVPTYTTGGFGPSLGTYLISKGYSPTAIVGNPSVTNPETSNRTVIGDRQADFEMSFGSQLNFFKNFDFNFLVHYKDGGRAINLSALLWDDGGATANWEVDGVDRITAWAGGNTSVYVQDASYVKLREVALYYTIPKEVLSNALNNAISRIKIGVSANNILLSTKYGSYDPEVSNFGSQPIAASVEVSPYPSSRRFFFHLAVDF